MNIKTYRERKNRGLIKIIETKVIEEADGHAFSIKRFNPETGDELEPEIESINLDELTRQKTDAQMQVVEYIALINDINAVVKQTPQKYIERLHAIKT